MNIKYPLENVQTLSVKEIVTSFQTDSDNGLTMSEATNRTKVFGTNIYQIQKEKSIWHILLQQFISPIVYLLVFGAAVSLFFNDYLDAIAIGVVIFINALIGFLMEMQARSSMHALRKMDVIKSKVIRQGKVMDIAADKLTPGDVIMLEAGDVIPADGRLIEANHLQCDESSLTGESLPTVKNTDELTKDVPLGDRINMVFKGASVMNGNGKAVITGIAQHTQLGSITSLVESSASSATPLDKKLNALSKKLIWITLGMTLIFSTTGIIQGKAWKSILETSIALAVAAIPEGLPIVATIALAYGMLLMAKRNAIVKKLSAVETLGSTSVILTDKTGTLTENKISVEMLSFPGEQVQVKIENSELRFDDGQIERSKENFEKLILIGTLCNDANAETEKKKATGDPIEIALLHLTAASEANAETLNNEYERLNEVPFNSVTKIMGTLHQGPDKNFVAAKGSVEDMLVKCSKVQSGTSITDLTSTEKSNILAESEKMSANGLRVLAFAYKEGTFQDENYLSDLIYVGMIGFLDPPRLDIKETILSCRKAGIRVVMITGDHPLTALNIAKRTGLVEQDEEQVITGKDLPAMDKLTEEWKKKILSTSVFARTTPKQKLEIEDVYQKAGNIVAMTGDGVNDAPALKKADVGIAMGLRGTAVAKETASIVLKDDSFTSITAAIAHGREIFQNIQKFVIYLVSCNMSEILIVTALGLFVPAATLIPLQILFLNIVTDVFPALALGLGRGDLTVMQRPPRGFKENIISTRDWIVISAYALTLTLSVILAVLYTKHFITEDEIVLNNMAFITLTFAQLFHVFNMSSLHSKLIVNEITTNKFVWFALLLCVGLLALVFIVPELRLVLKLNVLSPQLWIVAIIAGVLPLIGIQIYMSIWKKIQSHKSSA
ncbi:cation-translocating P-type ATPase [Algoriphagus aquimarinus]|uniref:Cation-translocating P-type ATPase n=1 Tax=Algoriphagus aquimarinus TaxID=237018 RepID=A0A5C7AY05_9BACT|nr:cation-translocating P-type ATPase [Algoriphagus aquimarinus]TXE13700.1 cation-translocating P-type ATPase [Algoriphagus aquimarinus]